MKRILIVNKSFKTGGIQSSMINLANELCNRYEVDIFAYYPEGIMKNRIDPKVNIIKPSWKIQALGMSLKEAWETKKIKYILFRTFATMYSKIFDNRFVLWIAMKGQRKLRGYDLAIAFHHEQSRHTVTAGYVRVLNRCVEASKKVSWIHYDPQTLDLDLNFNKKYLKKMDKIFCVSESVKNAFVKQNPEMEDLMDYCYNLIDYNNIVKKSLEYNSLDKKYLSENVLLCFSACRLSKEKGIERAIEAMSDSFHKNKNVFWMIAGDGSEKEKISNLIKQYGLDKQIILLGSLSNPYPYMRQSDLLINVSYHEAAPMVFLEGKALHIPIFATETLSAKEMIKENFEGIICDNSFQGIKNKFDYVVKNVNKIKKMKQDLQQHDNNKDFEVIDKLDLLMK